MTVATVKCSQANVDLILDRDIGINTAFLHEGRDYIELRKFGHNGRPYRAKLVSSVQGFLLTQDEFLGMLILPQDAYESYLTAIKNERKRHDPNH